jgi:hypothetical protein
MSVPVLPDGILKNKFASILQWKLGVFYSNFVSFKGKIVYFMVIWYILRLFGIFSRFGMLYREKSGNTVRNPLKNNDRSLHQGCQLAFFQTQNPNLVKFWRVLQWKMCWYNLWSFCLF